MFNKIKKVNSIGVGSGESAGVGVKNDQLRINFGSVDGTAAAGLERLIPCEALVLITAAATTIKNSDHGKYFVYDATGDPTFTLPAVTASNKGVRVRVGLKQLPGSGTGLKVAPAAVDKIMGNGFTAVDNKAALLAVAGDRVGDYIEVTSDGVDGWFITDVVGTWTNP